MVKRLALLIICLLFTFNSVQTACAKNKRFEAAVQKNSINVNESVLLSLTAYDFRPEQAPQLPTIQGFETVYRGQSSRGSSSMTIIVNGKRQSIEESQSFIYQYELIPKNTGVFTIPSISITSEGTRYRTRPISITVSKTTETNQRDVFIETHLSVNECYVEQPVVLDVKLYFSKQVTTYSLSIPFLPSFKNFIIKDIDIEQLQRSEVQKIQYNGQVVDYFQSSTELYKGIQYNVLTLRKIIVPIASGEYTFEPATFMCEVLKGYKQPNDSFGFFSRRTPVTERRVVRSESEKFIVKQLPEAPANYPDTVSVGRYSMNVGASPKQVKVGDPVTLSIVVAGEGNIEGINEPKISDDKNFRKFTEDAKSEISVTGNGIKGKKIFQMLLIPTTERAVRIPPLELSYFDPFTGSYKKELSNPIPIKVLPAPKSNAPVIIEAKSDQSGKKEVHIVYKDLPGYIKENQGETIINKGYIYHKIWYWLTFILSIFFNLSVFIVTKQKRKLEGDVKYRRKKTARKKADKIFNKAIKLSKRKKDFYSEIVRGLNEYFGGKLNVPSAGLTIDILSDKLKDHKIEPVLIKRVEDIYRNADMARFMPSFNEQETEQDILKEVKETVSQLEKHKW